MLSLVAHHSAMPHNNSMFGGASVEPSQLEVDYDVNITTLYEAICNCDWDLAVESVRKNPHEARTWVVRHYQDEELEDDEEKEIMWRFLPIHSACARDPPAFVISALLKAYSDGAHCVDDQGMYALHYACGNQASREVIRLLLVANSMAAKCADPRGMLPIHYLACWGPSSVSIIDMVMVANRDVGKAQDNDGNTPLDLAMEGDYPERNQVVVVLKRWLEKSNRHLSGERTPEQQERKSTTTTPTRSITTKVDSAPSTPVPTQDDEELAVDKAESEPHDDDFANDNEGIPSQEEEQEETPEGNDEDDDEDAPPPPPQEDPVSSMSPRLAVNTAIDDQVEVKICSSPLSQMQPHHDDNEENAPVVPTLESRGVAEEKESLSTLAPAMPSPRTVSRLRQEVTKLRMEKNQSEADWEQKFKKSVEVLDGKCNEMVAKVEELKSSLEQANTKIATLEDESNTKDQCILDTESQLSDALERIQGVEQEYMERVAVAQQDTENVKQELAAMEMENLKLAKEIENRNERLYSLTASIETMMERQDVLMQSVNDKNAQLTEASQARRQNLKMLFDMEQDFMEAIMGDDETLLEFEKQMKEMEAMTAVINTMKD